MDKTILHTKPDGTEITLRDVQLKTLEILRVFDKVCKENDIEYALAFGTALGAVRHKGFIPWDDDVDVLMDYKNYDKLVETLKKETPKGYYFHCFETEDRYNVLIPSMKFRMAGTKVIEQNKLLMNKCEGDGLFIDVFIFDTVSDSKWNYLANRAWTTSLMPLIVLFENMGFNPLALKRYYNKYARRYSEKHRNSNMASLSILWTYDRFGDLRVPLDVIYPMKPIEFEGELFPCVAKPHEFLVSRYGPNYMQLPPVESRKPKHVDEIEL